ncbi:hypothetical protein ACWC4D_08080 [Streptomyces sp. NPDC001288]
MNPARTRPDRLSQDWFLDEARGTVTPIRQLRLFGITPPPRFTECA